MKSLLNVVATYVDRSETLAEAVLLHRLQSRNTMDAFVALTGFKGRFSIANEALQAFEGKKIVPFGVLLESPAGDVVRVMLKGRGGYSPAQLGSLKKGPEASPERRIDVLITPDSWLPEVHPEIKVVNWQQLEKALDLEAVGFFTELWANEAGVSVDEATKTGHALVAYTNGEIADADFTPLWRPLDYLKRTLPRPWACGHIGPGGDKVCWYGMKVHEPGNENDIWIGWHFKAGARGRFQSAFLFHDVRQSFKDQTERLPKWTSDSPSHGLTLWDSERKPQTGWIDFAEISNRLIALLK